jgi:glycosyltransferase involved in cell wall biosynthesis
MRILLTNQHFPPQYVGGSERAVQSLARELALAGDQVSVVARWPTLHPPEPVVIRERLPDDTRIYRLHGGEFELERFLRHQKAMDRQFTSVLLERRPDVVHVHHLRSLSPAFVELAVTLDSAIVISLHDFYFACPLAHLQKTNDTPCRGPAGGRECAETCFAEESNALARWTARADYYRLILSLAQRVICYSAYVAAWFEDYGVPRSRLRTLPLGIDSPQVRVTTPPTVAIGVLHIAFCGTVVRLKGPHVIIEALKAAGLGPVRLTILGLPSDQPYVEEMKRLAAGVPGLSMHFHGAYNLSELNTLLAGIDCVISPTLVPETFGLVPREALVRGIPVLVARLGALPEIVREGENGFTFDPRDPLELGKILSRLMSEKDLLPRLRRGARATRVETPAGHAASVRAVYDEAVEPSANRGLDNEQVLEQIRSKHAELLKLDFQ